MDKERPVGNFIQNKKNRSIFFLSISVFIILLLNATLPMIEGNSHYTMEAVETTYGEFQTLKEQDPRYTLSWASKLSLEAYRIEYVKDNELPISQTKLIEIPDEYPVFMNTKFFYQYTFWYVSTVVSLGSAVILFYSLFNYLLIEAKEKNKRYDKLVNEVEKMRDGVLDPVTFEPWMDHVFNYRRKIEQHKANVKYKLDTLERKTPYKTKYRLKRYFIEKNPEEQQVLLEAIGVLTKAEQKYFNSRIKFLSLLEQDYIDNYITNGSVEYFKYIHPMFIYNGVNSVGKTIDSYSLINSDAERISKDAGKKISLSLTITVLFAVLFTVTAVASIGQSPLWIIINVASKIAPLAIQVPMAFKYSDDFMDRHIIKNLIDRRSIGLLYLADMEKGIALEDPMVIKERKKLESLEAKRQEELTQGNLKVVTNNA